MQLQSINNRENNLITAITDDNLDKYSLFEKVLEQSKFFEFLNKSWKASGKAKQFFSIVIKPNISMMLRRRDVGTYTDPFLVIHLLRLLLLKGYTNIKVVESQNLYGNWFTNRTVVQVAARAGYFDESILTSYKDEKSQKIHVMGSGVNAGVSLIDLSLDTVLHDFGEPVGKILVGKTWINADFRINLAKMKSHFYSYYTLAIKNIYGCLPLQDKVRGYHCKKVVGLWTAHLIRAFPVHFSIIDAYSSADGWLGVKMKSIPTKTHTFIAGRDILAVDHFGASLMKLKPERSTMFSNLANLIPFKPYRVIGNAKPFNFWQNTLSVLVKFSTILEASSQMMDYAGAIATGGYDDCFPHIKNKAGLLKTLIYYLTTPINHLIDVSNARLQIRKFILIKRLLMKREQIPFIAESDFILSRITYLSSEDIDSLVEIIDRDFKGEVSFSGHYLFFKKREVIFSSRLFIANLAIVEILNHIHCHNMDINLFAKELIILQMIFPKMFGKGKKYPYCYK